MGCPPPSDLGCHPGTGEGRRKGVPWATTHGWSPRRIAALGFLAAAIPAAAQQHRAAPKQGRATFRVTSTAVQLVLRATGRDGRPVTNLRRSQIKILDNGHPGRIVSFRPAWRPRPPAAGSRRATPTRNAQTRPRAVTGPPRYLGFVIDLSAPGFSRKQARAAIAAFVRSGKARGRPLALFAVGSQGMMLIPFTADRAAFLARLRHVPLHWTPWGGGEALRNLLLDLPRCRKHQEEALPMILSRSSGEARNGCGRALVRQYTDDVRWHANDVLASLIGVVRYLQSLPGPKTLVYLGPGFMFSPGRVATLAYEADIGPADDLMLALGPEHPHVRRLADAAVRADVTLDGVDPRGLLTHSQSLPDGTRVKLYGPMGPQVEMEFWNEVDEGDHDGLEAAVAPTGGVAMLHSNNVAGEIAAAVGSNGGVYYASYVPFDRRQDGRFHKIKVVTSRRGVRIRTRMGYYAIRPKRLAVTFWAGKPGEHGVAPVCARLRNRSLHWNGHGKRRTDLMSVWTRVANDSGAIVGSDLWAPHVSPGPKGYLRLTLWLRLPARGSLAVHISEVSTGRTAAFEAPVSEFHKQPTRPETEASRGSCGPGPKPAGR